MFEHDLAWKQVPNARLLPASHKGQGCLKCLKIRGYGAVALLVNVARMVHSGRKSGYNTGLFTWLDFVGCDR